MEASQQVSVAVDSEAAGSTEDVGDVGDVGDVADVTDTLPPEVLSHIFSFVADGRTLLDVLPLVCKRWRRAARDPASWAGVQLRLDIEHDSTTGQRDPDTACCTSLHSIDDARLLLHAPAAASLELCEDMDMHPYQNHILSTQLQRINLQDKCRVLSTDHRKRQLSAMRRTSAMIRRVDCKCTCDTFWSDVVPFLSRQRGLRALGLLLNSAGHGERHLKLDMFCRPVEPMKVLPPPCASQYNGELAGRLPQLRELRLNEMHVRYCLPDGLVGDLVRGAAESLRVLEVDLPRPCDADRDACAALEHVEHVVLQIKVIRENQESIGRLKQEAADLCAAIGASLQTAKLTLDFYSSCPVYCSQIRRTLAIELTHL